MRYYKVTYRDAEGKIRKELHVPETVRIQDNPAVTIIKTETCNCRKCLQSALKTLDEIREMVE